MYVVVLNILTVVMKHMYIAICTHNPRQTTTEHRAPAAGCTALRTVDVGLKIFRDLPTLPTHLVIMCAYHVHTYMHTSLWMYIHV